MKKKIAFILLAVVVPLFVDAKDITSSSSILINEKENGRIKDTKESTYTTINSKDTITIKNSEDIYGLYIIYEREGKAGIISNQSKNAPIGTNGFLHEYINVEKLIGHEKEITLKYTEEVKIADIYVFSEGELPAFIEVWDTPCKNADLLLFSTHSDDEQLFFLGLLPTYVAKNKKVQVVYFTNHYDNTKRLHEQLHGLYVVGIRNYPIIGIVPDAYSTSLEGALKNLKNAKLTEEDALNFEVEMLRRFKPQVVVGHDELGEYSHGQHILNTYILKQAITLANDTSFHETSFLEYGTWDVPKTYLHLYKENKIIMDYDIPLSYFNGHTAYEVSKAGYKEHLSQQYTWFTSWMNGKNNEYTSATEIKKYSPLEFGLYRSLVGVDIEKNDMFENIKELEETEEQKIEPEETEENKEEQKKSKKDKKRVPISAILLITLLIMIGIQKGAITWTKKKS